MKRKPGLARPKAVTVVIVVLWIQTGLMLALSTVTLAYGDVVREQSGSQAHGTLVLVAAFYLVYAAVVGALTVALTGGRNWARTGVIVMSSIGLVASLITMVASEDDLRTYPAIIIGIAIISVLVRGDAREWCLDRAQHRERDRRKAERDARKRPVR